MPKTTFLNLSKEKAEKGTLYYLIYFMIKMSVKSPSQKL